MIYNDVPVVINKLCLKKKNKNPWERRLDEYRTFCGPLLQAAMKGDWPVAKAFLEKHPDCVQHPITIEKATALHSAAAAKHTNFVERLLKWMTPGDLELKTIHGDTALYVAAQTGKVKIANEMVKKNNELPLIPNDKQLIPLHAAAFKRDRKMVDYLFSVYDSDSVTPFPQLTTCQRIELFRLTVSAGFYDIALKILKKDPCLATANAADTSCGRIALEELAKKPFAIGSKSQLSFWKKRLNSWSQILGYKGIYNNALMRTYAHQLVEELWKMVYAVPQRPFSSELPVQDHMILLVEAAKVGNIGFLIIFIRSYPDLLWQLVDEENGISLFHIAIIYRQKSVFNLIYEIGVMKENITNYIAKCDNKMLHIVKGDNMLHIAGKLAPLERLNTISIGALEMQQELLWFQEIEQIVSHSYVSMKNSKDETPRDIFRKAHKCLHKEGEKWMKETASNCMLVATLIATVVFTVPGGNN